MIEELVKQLPTATPFFTLIAGFVIGLSHAFEPDHVVAVATQNSKLLQKSSSSRFYQIGASAVKSSILGVLWGAGHTSALVLVSLLIFVFSMSIPEKVFGSFELGVGLMLVALGVFTYRKKALIGQKHIHPHAHDNLVHTHPHSHDNSHTHGHKSYIIGCIHGLAGSGSLVVLALSTLNNLENILSLVMMFGAGSIVGMMLVSSVLGLPFSLARNSGKINKILRYVVGSISVVIGIDILYGVISSGNFVGIDLQLI